MDVENREFRLTPEFRHNLQALYSGAREIYLNPMISREAVYHELDVVAGARRIAQACEVIYRELGLTTEQARVSQEAIVANSLLFDY